MKHDPDLHRRKSIRLPGRDYSDAGYYFVTICTKNREMFLGEIINDKMVLNDLGQTVEKYWLEIPTYHPNVELDVYQIMPNHLHGIINILDYSAVHVGAIHGVGAIHELPLRERRMYRRKMLLSKIIGRFKMNSAKRINIILNSSGAAFWQRNYYEHIIKNEKELQNIRAYILDNPYKWSKDKNNPKYLISN